MVREHVAFDYYMKLMYWQQLLMMVNNLDKQNMLIDFVEKERPVFHYE
jgi:hypothetical protein